MSLNTNTTAFEQSLGTEPHRNGGAVRTTGRLAASGLDRLADDLLRRGGISADFEDADHDNENDEKGVHE